MGDATDVAPGFRAMWQELAEIGRSPAGGYDRFSFTAADAALRAWFVEAAEDRGLEVGPDRNANLWAWWGDGREGAVVTGSHLDSVPSGGAYDGPLGVVSALLAIDELRRRSVTPHRPIAVAVFAEEEGARFGVACLGSRLLCGSIGAERARSLRDAAGTTLAEAMAAQGLDPNGLGADDELVDAISSYVELHVEQGRALAPLGFPLGVASGIWPHGRWRLSLVGVANHAGTTPIVDRHDPMLVLSTVALAARRLAEKLACHATVGKVTVAPNAANAVAARVDAFVDVRAPNDDALGEMVGALGAIADASANEHGVALEFVAESVSPAVVFDPVLRDRVLGALGGVPVISTAAGHDAGVLSEKVPSSMLFVRNPTGASHSPAESADLEDCVAGVRALAGVLEDLATR